ncbi:MAG: SDR family NAD(P)-dependent oxidoreductase [Spirochaetaceae bacterium]
MKDKIGPVLRGVLWDGAYRRFVTFREKEAPDRSDVLTLPGDIIDAAGSEGARPGGVGAGEETLDPRIVEEIVEAVVDYEGRMNSLPRAITVPGVGTWGTGESYELAAQRAEGNLDAEGFLPVLPKTAMARRATVMEGRIAVVTGGAQGFGAEIVGGLVDGGAFVVIADLNHQGAQRYAEELNDRRGRIVAMAMEVNVSRQDSVADLVGRATAELGGLDLLVSNAGVLKAGSVKELSVLDFSLVTSVNYTGFFLCSRQASRVFELQNRGAELAGRPAYFTDIIQINSKSGLEGSSKNGAYAGGKFGGIGLVQSFAKELITDRVKVNAICPGNFLDGPLWSDPKTGLFVQYLETGKVPGAKTVEEVRRFYEDKVPAGRGCTGDDVIRAIYYAVEQVYETGQAIPVTGGQVMLS